MGIKHREGNKPKEYRETLTHGRIKSAGEEKQERKNLFKKSDRGIFKVRESIAEFCATQPDFSFTLDVAVLRVKHLFSFTELLQRLLVDVVPIVCPNHSNNSEPNYRSKQRSAALTRKAFHMFSFPSQKG